jgi:hypothetical protein
MGQGGVPELVERPAVRGRAEQIGRAAVGQAGAAGQGAPINRRHRPRWLAIGQEHGAGGAATEQPREQECGAGLPEHPLDGPALAPDTGTLVGEVEVLDVQRQELVGARRALVQQPVPLLDARSGAYRLGCLERAATREHESRSNKRRSSGVSRP